MPDAFDDIYYRHASGEVTAAPQATWDLPMDRLLPLLKRMRRPDLGETFGRDPGDPATHTLSGESQQDSAVLAGCADLVEQWVRAAVPAPDAYKPLMGVSALALSYLVSGHAHTERAPYTKLLPPLLARTSFSSMWKELAEAEKCLFDRKLPATGAVTTGEAPVLTDTDRAANLAEWLAGLAGQYLKTHRNRQDAVGNPPVYAKDLLSPPPGGSKSMGAYEAKRQEAMVELRRIPKHLPVDMWTAFAERIYELYAEVVGAEFAARREEQEALTTS